jgi:uncharacterized coiled-coil protein SlyX
MADLEQRVIRLEERSEAQTHTVDYLRQEMSDLRRSMETLAAELRGGMADLRSSFDRRFTWLVGLMVTGFVATIGTIAGAFWGLLQFVR